MDKFWNMTVDFLAKINTWIPLVTVLWAGIGLIGVVLILAITGYVLRKRLVQQWLIWTYFIFATIIIFAQADGDIFTVVAHMEVPSLVVLLCYFLRLVFYRRPRYTYLERTVCVREIDNTPVAKAVNVVEKNEDSAREVENTVIEEVKVSETNAEIKDEVIADNVEIEKNTKEDTQTTEEETEEKVIEEKEEKTSTVEMPVVEPIPDKTYEAPREAGIVTVPVSETLPELKTTVTASRSTTATVPTRSTGASSSLLASRSATITNSTTATRPATTTSTSSTTTTRPNAFASIYNPRTIKTTTTTTSTTTNVSSGALNASSSVSRTTNGLATGVNRTTTSSTASAKNPRSTDDIMAAIARLRASMKK